MTRQTRTDGPLPVSYSTELRLLGPLEQDFADDVTGGEAPNWARRVQRLSDLTIGVYKPSCAVEERLVALIVRSAGIGADRSGIELTPHREADSQACLQ